MTDESRQDQCTDARIPFRIRIGITGHRNLDPAQREDIARAIREVLQALPQEIPGSPARKDGTETRITMISSLADGADRIAAQVALEFEGARLEAPLPFPQDEYEHDFDDASTSEFRALLGRAESSVALGDRSDGYRPVGWFIVDRADVLIAVWNGVDPKKEGGTADIVRRAMESGVPVIWVPGRSCEDDGTTVDPGAAPAQWADLEAWNSSDRKGFTRLASESFQDVSRRLLDEHKKTVDFNATLAVVPTSQEREPDGAEDAADRSWCSPWERAADHLADGYQHKYRLGLSATFLFAACAATVIAAQTVFGRIEWINPARITISGLRAAWLGLLEVILLIVLFGIVRLNKHRDTHRRYIEYRFLAERLRAAPFLADVGADVWNFRPSMHNADVMVYRSENWPWRVFDEIWTRRPAPHSAADATEQAVEQWADLIASAWARDERTDFSRPQGSTDPATPRSVAPKIDSPEYAERVRAIRELPKDQRPPCQFFYHQHTYLDERRAQRRLSRVVNALFIATFAAAVLHLVLEVTHYEHGPQGFRYADVALFLSITLAASGAALSGYIVQRGHHRQAARSLRMMIYLAVDDDRMRRARTLDQLRERVEETHRHMLAENRLWFESLSYEEIELHT